MRNLSNWKVRIAGIILVLATFWYLPWVYVNLNWAAPWLALPFAFAVTFAALLMLIAVVTNWRSQVPVERRAPTGEEPEVLVVIPTHGEPPAMIYETARSVLEQDYPIEKIKLVISDDSHRLSVRGVVEHLRREYPDARLAYHEPPRHGDPKRRGDGKAGNLNSVLDAINRYVPQIAFIETRDADDLVGDPTFLRQTIGQLLANPRVAFVQTIKQARVSPSDPFGNLEPLFYRRLMLSKNATNSVFPCGSGVVWRRIALNDIGGFPVWNLVEDLQSGVEALRRGWRGLYLPIVGAIAQTAPEDIPNLFKQRGTWAIDTLRLMFWGDKRGLNLLQRLSFLEIGLFYLLSLPMLVFTLVPVISLGFDIYPIYSTPIEYALHLWPYVAAMELTLVALAEGLRYEDLWRFREMMIGMAPVYLKALWITLRYGPRRKPAYRVTRKEHIHTLYWREIWLQNVLLLALVVASIYHLAMHSVLRSADLGSLFWAAFFILALSRIVRNAWHGVNFRTMLKELYRGFGRSAVLRGLAKLFVITSSLWR
ncbi:MAG: glycosyltransferase [Anaerolineae bacterium]|nr:glycosyltransferase [Anaerolineae bacterium]MDW8071094.1 glycosyltransferase [Anaerolineae bacterium]